MPNTCLVPPTSRLMPRQSPGYLPCSLHSLFIADHSTAQPGVSLWSVGVCCPGCPPSQPLAHPTEGVAEWQTEVALMLCNHCSATENTGYVLSPLFCVINIVLAKTKKHGTILAAMTNINSTPDRSDTLLLKTVGKTWIWYVFLIQTKQVPYWLSKRWRLH